MSHHHHVEPKDSAGAAPEGFAAMLRRGTQDLHEHAESGALQQRMVTGEILRDEFVAFLSQVRHVLASMEPLMREAAAREPRLASMLREEHFRLEKIDLDLQDFGAETAPERLGATERFVTFVSACAERDPVSLIGVLYVKEGATNGNKIVAMRLREGLQLPAETPLRYLDPHGAEQRRRWMEFKAGLDAVPLSEADRLRCLDAARATFRFFIDLSEELSAGVEGDAAYTLRSS